VQAPAGARYCAACGHRLGWSPEQPVVVEVQPPAEPERGAARTAWDGCIGCFSWAVVGVLVVLLVGWVLSC
jgi:hypothetical protein